MRSTAILSRCGTWRYWLKRRWSAKPLLPFVMLNPSTADASKDDPTIRRCMSYARRVDAGGILVCNLFALRATDPMEIVSAIDPVGPRNPVYLRALARYAVAAEQPIVCAWGAGGKIDGADADAMRYFRDEGARTVCLGVTKGGLPRHPLYLRRDTLFEAYA